MSAIIDEIVALIRGARYGRDVRESIAHGIEVIDDVAEGARDSATASAADAQNYAHSADQSASNAHTSEVNANSSATTASQKATLSESWAVGGTGTRTGEDTNNAKYWSEQAQGAVTGVISFNGRIGAVVPTNGDYNINQISNNGTSGQVPLSDGNGGWTMGTPSTVGDLDDLSDVNITSPSDGQTLVYDSANQKWANGFGGVDVAPVFDETVAYTIGDYVTYNGYTYQFKTAKTAGAWDSTKVEQRYAMGAYITAGKKSDTYLGQYATAEGNSTTATGICSHAEGFYTKASGGESHAEGNSTTATGAYSHAEGYWTQTGADYQHVQGKYNVGKSTTLFEIGNGTNGNRANAFEVDTSGNVVAGGDITDGGGHTLADAPFIHEVTWDDYVAHRAEYTATGDIYKIKNQGIVNSASGISYDNTNSGMIAGNVQGAIDELSSNFSVESTTANGLRYWKFGRVVMVCFDANNITATANTPFAYIPSGYLPIYGFSVRETLNNKKLFFSDTDGIYCGEALSNANIRGSFTYICQ